MFSKKKHVAKRKGEKSEMNDLIVKVLTKVMANLSDTLRKEITDGVKRLENAAAASKNPWDDLAVNLLKYALGIE